MVASRNRFKRSKPCPICSGFDNQERGKGNRCYGFLSDDGEWAHCTREEWAGGLPKHTESETFAHKLFGSCNCGIEHNPEIRETMKDENTKYYDYTDEQGETLFQVCRAMDKKFFQRRPDGNGGWVNNLGGVRRVLYRLPELLEANDLISVFICEGEKDVDALCNLNLVATTNSGGANKWRREYNEALKGRHVVILPDNDDAGREHAAKVAASLNGIAASVRVIELPNLPEKGDVSDWLANGGTVEQLHEIVGNAPIFGVQKEKVKGQRIQSAADLLAKEFPEPKFAVYGLFSEGVTIFAGKPKAGKSWCGLGIAIAVASGQNALGTIPVEQGDVLYLALEDGERRLKKRLQQILGKGEAPEKLDTATEWNQLNEGGIEELEEWLKLHPQARLIVIDTLKRVRAKGKGGTQLYDQDYDAVAPLGDLARKYGVSIVVIHHTRKADSEDPLDLISGSFGLSGSADGVLVLKRVRGQSEAELYAIGRDFDEQKLALKWDAAICGWKQIGDAGELFIGKERRGIIDLLKVKGSLTPKQTAILLSRNEGATRKLMAAMAQDGQLENDGAGVYSLPNTNNGNYSNSGNYNHFGNSGNSDLETANTAQGYFVGGRDGNPVNSSYNRGLGEGVTGVTIVTTDSKQDAFYPLFDGESNIPQMDGAKVEIPPETFVRVPVEELFS